MSERSLLIQTKNLEQAEVFPLGFPVDAGAAGASRTYNCEVQLGSGPEDFSLLFHVDDPEDNETEGRSSTIRTLLERIFLGGRVEEAFACSGR